MRQIPAKQVRYGDIVLYKEDDKKLTEVANIIHEDGEVFLLFWDCNVAKYRPDEMCTLVFRRPSDEEVFTTLLDEMEDWLRGTVEIVSGIRAMRKQNPLSIPNLLLVLCLRELKEKI